MKVYLNSEGAILQTVPSVIPRGSTVTDFEVEAPFSAAIMAVRFTLRTGTTEPMILPMVSSVSAPGLNLWSAKLDAAVTEFSGSVPYSIEVQDASGYLIRTVKGSLTISPGQTPTVPSAPPQDVWTAIRDYLNQILSYSKEAAIESSQAKEWIAGFEAARGITVTESGKSVLYKLIESGTLSELVAMLEAYQNGDLIGDNGEPGQDGSSIYYYAGEDSPVDSYGQLDKVIVPDGKQLQVGDLVIDAAGDLYSVAMVQINGSLFKGTLLATLKGAPGAPGVSPTAKVEQTDGGAVISITDANGTTTANIANGKEGGPGKSAYAYAQDGGYDGTEEEFAKKLASDEGQNYVTAYGAKGDGVTDDTAAFKSAMESERVVFVPGGTYKLSEGITIGDNCCLELSQDTVLDFTNTEGNCITLGMISHLKGNHATVKVPYEFSGNVVYAYSADTLEAEQKAVPPFTQWDPMWKSGRYVSDLNICKADSRGFHYAVNPEDCKGTAVYSSASGTAGALTYMWGIHYTNLRIAGAFSYGIRAVNINNGWTHEMRIDAFIDACEIGVSLEECGNVYVSAIVQPRRAYSTDKVYKPYAKHGIQMIRSKNVDLSGSRVWDWNATNTLWTEGGEYQHISMIGDCSGAIINDYMYHGYGDTRNRIYTDTKSNLDQITILQEPIDRWFKIRNGDPYYNDGAIDRKLVTQETLDEHFTTDLVKKFTDVLPEATDTDGSIFGGVGYKNGRLSGSGVFAESAYYTATGFIPLSVGKTLYVHDMTYVTYDGYCCVCLYDSAKNFISYASAKNLVTGSYYYIAYTATDNGFSISPNDITANANVAYVRLSVYKRNVGNNPMASIDEPIKYTVEGFLADGVKVKGENVIGNVGEVQPDWIATHTYTEGESVYDERNLFFENHNTAYLKDYGGSFKINIGIEYDVYWGGKRYTCEAKSYDDTPYLGNGSLGLYGAENTGEPFCLYGSFTSADTIAYVKKDNSETATISLKVTFKGEAEYSKMPVEYLPDEVALKSDIPEGDGLEPLIGTTEEITPTQVAEAVAEGRSVAITHMTSEFGSITFCSFNFSEGMLAVLSTNIFTNPISKQTITVELLGEYDTESWGVHIEEIAKKSDLPSDGGSASIDVTAEVGQTIVVKEVDKNGKPTKWESAEYQPRTHWSEFTQLMPTTTITPYYNESFGIPMGDLVDFDIVVGNKYKVTFDGVDYICDAFIASMAGMSAPAFGNNAVAGGENTGEPFAIFRMAEADWAGVVFFDMNPHTIRVEGEVVHKIPERYMTSNDNKFIVHVNEDGTCIESIDDMYTAYSLGKTLVCEYMAISGSFSNATVFLPLANVITVVSENAQGYVFGPSFMANGTNELIQVLIVREGGKDGTYVRTASLEFTDL